MGTKTPKFLVRSQIYVYNFVLTFYQDLRFTKGNSFKVFLRSEFNIYHFLYISTRKKKFNSNWFNRIYSDYVFTPLGLSLVVTYTRDFIQ